MACALRLRACPSHSTDQETEAQEKRALSRVLAVPDPAKHEREGPVLTPVLQLQVPCAQSQDQVPAATTAAAPASTERKGNTGYYVGIKGLLPHQGRAWGTSPGGAG